MEYSYPLDESWSKQEMIDVVNFFSLVEQAYEQGVKREDLMITYTRFKQIVPSKSEEKQLFAKFEKDSGYSSYHTIQKAKESQEGKKINMKTA
ncbi:UPF0223 family protein [Aquibacillus sp. 3ASR75-11]|uniref:UPF0223 protein NC797_04365 n=1 Tax=Terrihalobacillus insolitus TaxID=2950438 RepID=A0A9X3WT37_9BACI|nr:UPF0223 family protein [Terrihalobacillus insolitus]MDC3412782.1 UPF0223 family protein [Terrihalobacillus insolitus]MDC3423741.1 UPF0223 family protein [Terrihalobacillus insolitus]